MIGTIIVRKLQIVNHPYSYRTQLLCPLWNTIFYIFTGKSSFLQLRTQNIMSFLSRLYNRVRSLDLSPITASDSLLISTTPEFIQEKIN